MPPVPPAIAAFEGRAEAYDAWYDDHQPVFAAEREALAHLIDDGGRGLEIGTGTGRFAAALGVDVGVEPATSMATRARERGVAVVRGVGERLPFADASFERVLVVATLAFLDDPSHALAEARRVLTGQGRIVVGILDRNSPVAAAGGLPAEGAWGKAASYRTAVEIDEALAEAGFELVAATQTIFDPIDEIDDQPSVREGAGEGLFAALAARPREPGEGSS